MSVETSRAAALHALPTLDVRLLGPMRISRGEYDLALPASRKVRALLAYLALTPEGVGRSYLCDLLWDAAASDPRGELRWCLSKIRALVDEPQRKRLLRRGDQVRLDLSGCRVDALELMRATGQEPQQTEAALKDLAGRIDGDLLDGHELDRCPRFDTWLAAQRRHLRDCHVRLLERLAEFLTGEEALACRERLVQLSPFDRRGHLQLLAALAHAGKVRAGEEHLAAAIRLFEAEGLDAGPLRKAWSALKDKPHDKGVAAVLAPPPSAVAMPDNRPADVAPARRASIAVMPFEDRSSEVRMSGGLPDAIAHDVIGRLAKLRCLFVIAQGTMITLGSRQIGAQEAGRILDVDYVLSGTVECRNGRVLVEACLSEARSGRVIWADTLRPTIGQTLMLIEEIGNRIVASVASEIEAAERNRAILRPPSSLDAWEAYHRGLWHMYRFSREDNELGQRFFQRAVGLDPTFARAHAGLSFTHWQIAFQGWGDRSAATELAYRAANDAIMADERDPAAHWAMGRALWLSGRHEPSITALGRAAEISPNFALAHYNLAFVHATSGDAARAVACSDTSRSLSPFDPMLFGIFGSRAMALVRLGRFDEAADWGVKAATRPNAIHHIQGIAAFSLALAGRLKEAREFLARAHAMSPNYAFDNFARAFQFDQTGTRLFRDGATRLGLR